MKPEGFRYAWFVLVREREAFAVAIGGIDSQEEAVAEAAKARLNGAIMVEVFSPEDFDSGRVYFSKYPAAWYLVYDKHETETKEEEA